MQASSTDLETLWRGAVARCDASTLTAAAIGEPPDGGPLEVLCLGKAAGPMAEGVVEAWGAAVSRMLVVGPVEGPRGPEGCEWLGGEHPVPGEGSFRAGRRVLEWAAEARRRGARVLVCVSGGASAICEHPAPGLDAAVLAAAHRTLVRSGLDIATVNLVRRSLSAVKGGGVAVALGPALARVRVLADVTTGRADDVGSGPVSTAAHSPQQALAVSTDSGLLSRLPPTVADRLRTARPTSALPSVDTAVIGTPQTLVDAALAEAGSRWPTHVRASLVGGVGAVALAEEVASFLEGQGGLWVAAGEVEVAVPDGAPAGGRAQHLALAVCDRMAASACAWTMLAAGSDGADGGGVHAGAVVSHELRASRAAMTEALAGFDSEAFHRRWKTGLPREAPRTNLTDLYLAWAPPR